MLLDGKQPLWAVFGEVLHRDAVHATGPGVGLHLCPSQFKYVQPVDLIDQAEPLVSFDPHMEGRQHLLAPDRALRSVAGLRSFSSLFIPNGNSRRWFFTRSRARSVCLPAALGSIGITRLRRYYGGSDSCGLPGRPKILRPQVSCVHNTILPRPAATKHNCILQGDLRDWRLLRLTRRRVKASSFNSRLAGLQSPNRVHFFCFLRLIWFFPLLSTPPRGDAVTSSSQPVNGPSWSGSFTPKDGAAPQRTIKRLRRNPYVSRQSS